MSGPRRTQVQPQVEPVRRVAFTVGDTVGHVMLPLAVAEAYRAVGGVDCLFLAAPGGPADRLVPAAGFRLGAVRASALARVGPVGKLAALARLVPGLISARRALADHGTRLVIGSGGFSSGSVLLAARSLGLRTAIIEPNATPGLANRLIAPLVHRGYFTCSSAASLLPSDRRCLAGTPVRPAVVTRLLEGPRRPPLLGRRPHVFVSGGSRGDDFLAAHVPALMSRLYAEGVRCEVRHQVNGGDPALVRARYASAGVDVEVLPFLPDLVDAYRWADLAIVRAGATTLAELALAALPALLVPLDDAAARHQVDNAQTFASSGAALWCKEEDWNDANLATSLATLLLDVTAWRALSDAARQLATPEAAAAIVRDCETVMSGSW